MLPTKPEHQPRLFFDIETLADQAQLSLIEEPTAPANYKDPDKIAAYVAEKRAKLVERAALDPDTGVVCAVALLVEGNPPTVMTYFQDTERAMIEAFWSMLRTTSGHCVGYNILRFDLPFLMRRSFAIGIRPGIVPDLRRHRDEPVTDLMGILFNWDIEGTKGLKWVAKRYGIAREPLLDAIDGSMVKDLDEPTLHTYVKGDMETTLRLFDLMNGVYFSLT